MLLLREIIHRSIYCHKSLSQNRYQDLKKFAQGLQEQLTASKQEFDDYRAEVDHVMQSTQAKHQDECDAIRTETENAVQRTGRYSLIRPHAVLLNPLIVRTHTHTLTLFSANSTLALSQLTPRISPKTFSQLLTATRPDCLSTTTGSCTRTTE
jgi:hypothetical protein